MSTIRKTPAPSDINKVFSDGSGIYWLNRSEDASHASAIWTQSGQEFMAIYLGNSEDAILSEVRILKPNLETLFHIKGICTKDGFDLLHLPEETTLRLARAGEKYESKALQEWPGMDKLSIIPKNQPSLIMPRYLFSSQEARLRYIRCLEGYPE